MICAICEDHALLIIRFNKANGLFQIVEHREHLTHNINNKRAKKSSREIPKLGKSEKINQLEKPR